MLNGRNPVMAWCITVSSLSATLAGTLALGSGHKFWYHVLFWVALFATIPALGYMLLVGLAQTGRWTRQNMPAISWRRIHWSIPVGAVAVGVVALVVSQLGGGHPAGTASQPAGAAAAALVGPSNSFDALEGLVTPAGTVAFSGGGKTVAVNDCTGDFQNDRATGRVYLWSTATHKLQGSVSVPPKGKPDCGAMPVSAFSPNGEFLAAGDTNSDIAYLWRTAGNGLVAELNLGTSGPITDVAFSPDSRTLAVVDLQGQATLFDTATHEAIRDITVTGNYSPSTVTFSPDGKLLALGLSDGKTELANVSDGAVATVITDPPNKQYPNDGSDELATFSHDGKTLATTDGDGRTCLWDVASYHLVATLSVPGTEYDAGIAANAAFSPVNDTLATTDSLGNVYLWDAATRKVIATFSAPQTNGGSIGVTGLAFSPNGKTIAIHEAATTTYLWSPS